MGFIKKHHRILFYGAWLLLNVWQSAYTEVQDDEAYYWVFARYLSWGYFDHPPLIALLIKMGGWLLPGAVGLRLLPLLLNTATLWLVEKLTGRKDAFLFYAIALSVAVLQISGFVAVPDVPLMFFTALFFVVYRSFLQNPTWRISLCLGLVAAALLYSKYHGVLVLLFVLLSNPRLLKNPKIYAAGLLAFVLFVPHLWWQYCHNWISFRYHLFESNVNPYKFSYTTDYILGQLLLAGPFGGFILWPAAFLYRPANAFEKSMKWLTVGFAVFFLLSTVKGKVEPNWTSPAIIAVMALAHRFLLGKMQWRRWLMRLLVPTILLVIAFRIVMVVDLIPAQAIVERYHGWKHWPQQLKQQTDGLPVVFNNSYQRASKYWFYTGQLTYSMNKFDDRRNNYNFWPIEDSVLGKPVYVLDIYNLENYTDTLKTPLFTVGYRYDSKYHSFAKIQFKSADYLVSDMDSLPLHFTLDAPPMYKAYLAAHPEVDEAVALVIYNGQKPVKMVPLPFTLQQAIRQNITTATVATGLPKGNYFFRFGVMTSSGLYSHNSEKVKLSYLTPGLPL